MAARHKVLNVRDAGGETGLWKNKYMRKEKESNNIETLLPVFLCIAFTQAFPPNTLTNHSNDSTVRATSFIINYDPAHTSNLMAAVSSHRV